jgi:Domain of unknown function (DUF4160)
MMTKEDLKKNKLFHSINPVELVGFDELATYLEAILNGPCYILEINEELVLFEGKQLVETVSGLKIEIYPNEHPPPHFHVKSANVTASFVIEDCSLLDGEIDNRDFRKILYWHKYAKKELIQCWNETRPTNCSVGLYKGAELL